ncbi:unnamed protein product [Allacma fusca]|uniref:DUF5641 domain-containing protein n=1 Tax=Allacma fusca TaxID=39272 RepID=A0A8J2JYA4_9HEXA|nr:unnamed protein product [Allacma fusca]
MTNRGIKWNFIPPGSPHIDCEDDEALTPNHFLIGPSGCYQPLGNFDPLNLDLKRRWRLAQHLSDLFWKRWLREYLPCLTRRAKWLGTSKSIEVDDVVIIADERFSRNCWPKGIVTRAINGKDGKCRVAEVREKAEIEGRRWTEKTVMRIGRE